jgi:hypothetical protein
MDNEYYICNEQGILKGPYHKQEANRILDEIAWDEIQNFKFPDGGKHPYDKVMDEVQAKCDEIQVFRLANTNLLCQMQNFLDSRDGLKVGYVVAYVDFYQPVKYCSPDEVESVSGIETQKRFQITRTNFGHPKLVKWD